MKDVVKRLNDDERRVLEALDSAKTLSELSDITELPNIGVLRAGSYLADEGLVTKSESSQTTYVLTDDADTYVEKGLPELQIFDSLSDDGESLDSLRNTFSPVEVNAAIGRLKKQGVIELTNEDETTVMRPTGSLRGYKPQEVLESLPLLNSEADDTVQGLVDRGLVEPVTETTQSFERTSDGDEVVVALDEVDVVDDITPAMLEQETWKDQTFREYRITDEAGERRTGRSHFVKEAIDDVKDFWVSIGFQEMQGGHVQSAFWDLDALFVPQNHPARDLQDTFYLDEESSLPDEYVEKIRDVHESGGSLDSDGWSVDYNVSTAKKTLLRTHTTVLSAKKFAELSQDDLPKKYFSVDKVYRNETLDWSHLMEFHQVEGIVVTEEGSLSRLISYLKEFFGAMGYDDVRVRPAYFPYTEPSAEVEAYNAEKDEWVEIGGAGIIRPEVTEPLLGFTCPVMAWGTGLERLLTAYYDIHDLRELYDNDIQGLQEKQVFTNAHYIN